MRANWKGWLKLDELTCAVALYTAASSSERIALHTLNRKTGHRVQRQYVDAQTGKVVASDDQVKGYEASLGDYIIIEPEEIAEAYPESDKMLEIEAFVKEGDIDERFFDRPYYLAPSAAAAQEAFALFRDGMRAEKVGAIARAVLFRRMRSVLIRPCGEGLLVTTLDFDYEVRASRKAFADIPAIEMNAEMLELAGHIIKTKAGTFDPATFDDRYEAALVDLVQAKIEGRKIKPIKAPKATPKNDLLEALRASAGGAPGKAKSALKPKAKAAGAKAARKSAQRRAG